MERARTEAEFLKQRAEEARRAMMRSVQVLGSRVGQGVDPRLWARTHPWITLGGAAAGGFAAVNLLFPSQHRRIMRRLKAMERAAQRQSDAQARAAEAASPTYAPDQHGGKVKWAFGQLFSAVRPALMSAIFGALSAAVDAQSEPRDGQPDASADSQSPPTPEPASTDVPTSPE